MKYLLGIIAALFFSSTSFGTTYYQQITDHYNKAAATDFESTKGFRSGRCFDNRNQNNALPGYLYGDELNEQGPLFPTKPRFVISGDDNLPATTYDNLAPSEQQRYKDLIKPFMTNRLGDPQVVSKSLQTISNRRTWADPRVVHSIRKGEGYFFGIIYFEQLEIVIGSGGGSYVTTVGWIPGYACYFSE